MDQLQLEGTPPGDPTFLAWQPYLTEPLRPLQAFRAATTQSEGRSSARDTPFADAYQHDPLDSFFMKRGVSGIVSVHTFLTRMGPPLEMLRIPRSFIDSDQAITYEFGSHTKPSSILLI